MKVHSRNAFTTTRRTLVILTLIAPLSACGSHWDMSWNESGRPSRRAEGYRQYEGQGYSGGDSLGAAIFLGIVGIAWGIGELFEAIGGR